MSSISGSFQIVDVANGRVRAHSRNSDESALNGTSSARRLSSGSVASSPCKRKHAVVSGHVRWPDARLEKLSDSRSPAHALLVAYEDLSDKLMASLGGSFSLAIIDEADRSALLAIDRFGIEQLYWSATSSGWIYFSSSASGILGQLSNVPQISSQSVFNYLYCHSVPSPETIWSGIYKLQPGEQLLVRGGKYSASTYWTPSFDRIKSRNVTSLKNELIVNLADAVKWTANGSRTGAFLSGGLDSSTVCGILQQQSSEPVQTFSVGFSDEEYNELDFARIAVQHFGLKHHPIVATAEDTADRLEEIFAAFDEPFGNSSVVPTYLCALAAAESGVDILLAGDGGDELFAGNVRYAKQKLFQLYSRFPAHLRKHVLEPILLRGLSGVELSLIRKMRRYVEQAKIPLPARLESYNHLEMWRGDDIFLPDFLGSIDIKFPAASMNDRFEEAVDADYMDRMLYLDWKFTLADNDLRKVTKMCELAGVEARFPFLDERVVGLSIQVPSNLKLQGLRLRYFYKKAMQDFLPKSIINKSKHGFGLPFGEWLKSSPRLQDIIYSTLGDLGKRNIVRPEFIGRLITEHRDGHAGYYGNAVWVFMALEMWFKNNMTATSQYRASERAPQ